MLEIKIVRGRWASLALGAAVARSRAGGEMDQERQAYESQLSQSQRQAETLQRQIEALQQKNISSLNTKRNS
ncbi:MAG: hypothetical protein WA364_22005 [Candidatus Nitrosopolaris sp.]|jgi:hypothetical protein